MSAMGDYAIWLRENGRTDSDGSRQAYRESRVYIASGRNGYFAVDQLRPGASTGSYGEPLIFRTRKDAENVAMALNEAYVAGRENGRL